MKSSIENDVTFYDLKWDTDFFGVNSSKAILHKSLDLELWRELLSKFGNYQFISIVNQNSEPLNAQFIGKHTNAFLADVNIQFEKKMSETSKITNSIKIQSMVRRDDQIIQLADFQYSKFTEDQELQKRGGDQVYQQWLMNAFEQPDKYFAISRDENDLINGFLLHSYNNDACVIELIAVSSENKSKGVGTELFYSVEKAAIELGFSTLKVGTQVRNTAAINFYNKVGCKQIECNQVFHLWNL